MSTTFQCGPTCEQVFSRVLVYPSINGGTRVEWLLHPRFNEASPYTFQLECGRTGNPDADDWGDVGSAVVDTFYAIDDDKTVFGKFQWTHYRVKLTTTTDTYYSPPQNALGMIERRNWATAQRIIDRQYKRLQFKGGSNGYLLKRKLFGTNCTCVDYMTGEIRDPDCSTCHGTGFVGGYFDPVDCFYVELGKEVHDSKRDPSRGTVDDRPVVKGRMLNVPQVFSKDVWVEKDTDKRWQISELVPEVEMQGHPLILHPVTMKLLPFSDPAYGIQITGQVPA